MPKLDDLLSDLANFDAQHDLQGLRKTRETIVAEHPDSEAAVEAMYKIASTTARRSVFLGRPSLQFVGRKGEINAHSAFVRSLA